MKDIYSEIFKLLSSETPAALVTIIQVIGSSPRGMGARYLVPEDSPTIGTIGGGCLEAKVWQEALDCIERGTSSLLSFTLDDETMAGSGLICGGTVTLLVEPLEPSDKFQLPIYKRVTEMQELGTRGTLATILPSKDAEVLPAGSKILFGKAGEKLGYLKGGAVLEDRIRNWCEENLLKEARLQAFKTNGRTIEFLLEPILQNPTLYIFGAGHIAQALSPLGKMADFRVVIIDDRPMFADPERFPEVDEVLVAPFEMVFDSLVINPQSYVVIVTRGHLHDEEVLEQAIQTDAGYIGMIGSRRKIAILYEGLLKKGVRKKLLDRVRAPIGLDIHSETPSEIAISIIAQLVKVRAENSKMNSAMPRTRL